VSAVWSKLDSSLSEIYLRYLRIQETGAAPESSEHAVIAGAGRLNVSLQYTGELSEIEALGFATVRQERSGQVIGAIDLARLEQVAAHPGVQKMSFGLELKPLLDESVPDIQADRVWSHTGGGTFTGTTGAGVIIGIIDSGIDFRHPFFLKDAPTKKTRILRIWDQGLKKEAGEESPPFAFLSVGTPEHTYGVEYKDEHIDKVLNEESGATPVRHRDCAGHGTHVASIAAGNDRSEFKFIGVAPEADLIVVNRTGLQNYPTVGTPPSAVNGDDLLKDAVSYILKVAESLGPPAGPRPAVPPVVINASMGSELGPHDGFTELEDWLTQKFATARGRVFVTAAGNAADMRQHARIDFPAGGLSEVEIPFMLYDTRIILEDNSRCVRKNNTAPLRIQLYYPSSGGGLSVEFGPHVYPDDYTAGPPLNGPPVEGRLFDGRKYKMSHQPDNDQLTSGSGTVSVPRRLFELWLHPRGGKHYPGRHTLRVGCLDKQTVHIWCAQYGSYYGFRVAEPVPSIVNVNDECLIGAVGGAANVITVASYDSEADDPAVPTRSSRGPLAKYGDPWPPQPPPPDTGRTQPDKPDLAAPGVEIEAAWSKDSKGLFSRVIGGDTIEKGATSFAAPHVTGAAALLLAKKPTLTAAEVANLLKTHARKEPPSTPEEAGAGWLDAKKAFDNA
jgi:subtilisin family serine protease